jgi:mRNA turnover protein 4
MLDRIFFGKTKVMSKSLGSDPNSEHLPGLSQLTPHMKGDIGLLFTSRSPGDVVDHFSAYSQTDYARAGTAAIQPFIVPEGVVYSRGGEIPSTEDVPVSHSVETTLRRWGMPTRLEKGKVMLDAPYTVCKEGQVLNSNQTALLKAFGVAMAEFKVQILAYWSAGSGKVEIVDSDKMDSSN